MSSRATGSALLEVIDLLPEPMLQVDLQGSILAANLAAAAALRRTRRELPGQRLSSFTSETGDALREYLGRCARNGQFLPGALTLVRGRTTERYRAFGASFADAATAPRAPTVLLRLEPADHRSSAFNALNEKIRELHAEIGRRQLLEDSLREADRHKDEFLATMAHELRNPLAPMRNALQIMTVRPDLAGSGKLQRILEHQLEHMVRLLDDLMDASRITQGRIELRLEPVSLDAIIRSAAETTSPCLEKRSQHLRIEREGPPPLVIADATRLAQVLSNLLNNSSKYSPVGSEIVIRTMRRAEFAVLEVSDRGIGIPPDMLERVFDMFTQVPRPFREGLGIGLTLARRIVELHRGSIEAQSAGEGSGSTFTVRLPMAEEPDAPGARPTDQAAVQRMRGRVLIADDNFDAAETLGLMLEMEGHEVRIAHDGEQALRIAEEFRPQVALLDIGMPKLDGCQSARLLREKPWGRDVCLVALTGWGQERDRQRAREAGFEHHVVKPADPQSLLALVDRLLREDECRRLHSASGSDARPQPGSRAPQDA